MSHPISGTHPQLPSSQPSMASIAASKSRMMGAPARILLSIAAIAGGYVLVQDSWNGSQPKRDDAIAAIRERIEWTDVSHGWGRYTGQPGMENLADRFRRMMLYGPMNLKLRWQELTVQFNSWVNDVILPNLLPLAMILGGVAGLGGMKALGKGSKATRHFFKNHVRVPSAVKAQTRQIAGKAAVTTGKGLGKLLSLPVKSPAHLLATVGIGLFAAFGLKRFQDVYGQDAQNAFFRDFTNSKEAE